ncbi:phosphonate catabolism associated alcohol dehydrogenase [Beutenbergia cavernae DSM 12333]|uniref:alcohol dehydrogenase n=1 Tax=Beutenbergia cavernae (strain ATCC BAA-8 / DSM 12333 / CCUG 43141 / JCM 11478 / NBRC 16432 / NCIMB 13614 / HKI 0122) TaxID=471853 RepID=C5C0N3_BEUC1|nr:zinc-binding dehydrogenase [Beutenbergia cavernae]ACQ81429.1 phosphonate catabolism associated alcohol dehydrogenase [Beutenbergia cavernae DSM 12333]
MSRTDVDAVAMVWPGVGEPHEARPVSSVELAAADVLVRVELATVCGSDVHTALGHRSGPAPSVLGHEQVGRVVAAGPHARTADGAQVTPGTRVVWSVAASCGDCARCRRGIGQKCAHLRKYGHSAWSPDWELAGGFATHVHVLAGTALVVVPDDVPASVLAPASCATATVLAAVRAAERVQPLAGQVVHVTGAGMLGLTTAAAATDRGAAVVVSDPDPRRREAARAFGAVATVDPAVPGATAAALADADPGGDAHTVAFEMSGAKAAVAAALEHLGVGGVAVLVGSVSPAGTVDLDPERVVRNLLTVRGVHNYAPEDLLAAVAFLERSWRRYPFEGLVGDVLPLRDVDAALDLAAGQGAARVGLAPE